MDPENDGYEDLTEEAVEDQKPVKKTNQVEEEIEERYVAYKVAASEGIMDAETNLPIGTETNVILAAILNKLDNIEKSTG